MLLDDYVPRTSRLQRLGAAWKMAAIFATVGVIVLGVVRFGIFQAQSVRVEKVEILCYGVRSRNTLDSDQFTEVSADCNAVEKFVKEQPRSGRRSWRLNRSAYSSFRYQSPVDGAIHTGRIQRGTNDHGQAVKVGDEIVVYFSRLSTQSYTDFRSPTWP